MRRSIHPCSMSGNGRYPGNQSVHTRRRLPGQWGSIPLASGLAVLILLLGALSAEVAHSQVNVCSNAKTGFFLQDVAQPLPISGNCPDPDGRITFTIGPDEVLYLDGLGGNERGPLRLIDDNTAVGSHFMFFNRPHSLMITKEEPGGPQASPQGLATGLAQAGSIRIDVVEDGGPGECTAFAVGAPRCRYKVKDVVANTDCSGVIEDDIFCGACKNPCPKLGKNGKKFVKVYAGGKPTKTCSVKLKRLKKRCQRCTGRSFSVIEE